MIFDINTYYNLDDIPKEFKTVQSFKRIHCNQSKKNDNSSNDLIFLFTLLLLLDTDESFNIKNITEIFSQL